MEIIDYICEEIDDLERKATKDGKLSMAEMQYLDTLAHTKKSLLTAEAMEGKSSRYPYYYSRKSRAEDDMRSMMDELRSMADDLPSDKRAKVHSFIREMDR